MDTSEFTSTPEPVPTVSPNWVERFSDPEHYSPYSLAVLEACRSFFDQQLTPEHRKFLENTGASVLVTGSLLRGNARPGSDIDLMLVLDKSRIPPDITYFGYSQASTIMQLDQLKTFAVNYLQEKYPELYQQLFEVKLAQVKRSINKYQIDKQAYPDRFSDDPNDWRNFPEDKQKHFVEEHQMYFAIEAGIFDINCDLGKAVTRMNTEDDLSHGLLAMLFASDLHTLFGCREALKSSLQNKLRNLKETSPKKFDEFYSKIIKNLQSFLAYQGNNHFSLDNSSLAAPALCSSPQPQELLYSAPGPLTPSYQTLLDV